MMVMQEFRLPMDRKWEICFKERYLASSRFCHTIEASHQEGWRHSAHERAKMFALCYLLHTVFASWMRSAGDITKYFLE